MRLLLLPALVCALSSAAMPAVFAADAAGGAAAEKEKKAVKPMKLGKVKIAGNAVTVFRLGDLADGADLPLDLLIDAKGAAPKSVQVWVAGTDEANALEVKKRISAEAGKDGHWSATIELPRKLANTTTLWIELTIGEKKPVSSISLRP